MIPEYTLVGQTAAYVEITKDSAFGTGGFQLWLCQGCGSVTTDKELHGKWHEGYAQVADDAQWGGMLRPLK